MNFLNFPIKTSQLVYKYVILKLKGGNRKLFFFGGKEKMRTCAICSKNIYYRDICNKCYRDWSDIEGNLPIWAEALITIQKKFETDYASMEVSFTSFEYVSEINLEVALPYGAEYYR